MKNEELASKKRAVELYDSGRINEFEVGTTKGLQQIHRFLFQDVFDFAGRIRDVDLAKGNFRFAPVIYLSDTLKTIDNLPENSFDEIVKKYVEMNVAHPFREGNGRATRIWLDQILKKRLGKCVDWSKIGKEEYLSAMERSPINDLEIRTLLESALTQDIDDREVYMKGIQSSYDYEEQSEYDVHRLFDEQSTL
ncbi:MAG: Fic family protein [Candidatus Saccharibacteria bacterium]|nr:Fic family protein [Candidatus Saccharibacteria bacterium]